MRMTYVTFLEDT